MARLAAVVALALLAATLVLFVLPALAALGLVLQGGAEVAGLWGLFGATLRAALWGVVGVLAMLPGLAQGMLLSHGLTQMA